MATRLIACVLCTTLLCLLRTAPTAWSERHGPHR